ncbi:MAG: recombinase family protein [Ruminococcaceae bacterium]|nr:recombinase family protein [Oscillospiraceae bacterium]
MENDNRKYAVYSRKSKYTGKGESIGNQIELCKNYLITRYNANADDIIVYEDEGYTGANTKRPEFQKMIKDIRNKKIKTVICYRLDRISRNVLDFCNLKDELSDYNVAFISIREDFDTSTPMGSAMLLITSVFAQLERDTIAERIRDNMLELAKTGRWLGGNTPLGFKSEEVEKLTLDGKKRKLFKLSPVINEENTVKLIFEKFLELKSLTQLETYFIQHDIKTRNEIYFSRSTLKSILTNPVYAMADKDTLNYFTDKEAEIFQEENFNGKHGLMVYNKTIQKTGKSTKQRSVTDWIVAVGKHKGFISGNTWVQTQNLLDMNAERRYRKPGINTSLLSGVIYCNNCGSFMRPKLNSKIHEDGTRSFSYMCELKEKSRCKKCNSKNIMGIEFDKQMLEIVKTITSANGETYKKIKTMANGEFQSANINEDEMQTLQNTKKQNEKTIAKLIQKIALVDGDIVEELTEEIKRLKSANLEIEKSLSKLTDTKNNNQQQIEYAKLVLDIFDTYFQSFDKLDLVTKRSLIRLIIDTVEVDGENIYINLAGSDKNNPNQKILSLPELHSK